ncbi:unnamed protein product [Rangifer tarandus platyrhynchus]|uniref:Uncharacterized protein n=1 Tax=Rangifer tarandus platyrhynchus TaxID=3082113 RepID=A0AC59Z8C4_RANTA
MKCPSPPGAVPAANAAAAGGTRLPSVRPPSRRGRGRGRAGACEACPAAGPVGERARGRSSALCAPGRGAAGRGPGRLLLAAAELRARSRVGGTGSPSGPLSAAPRPAPFCAESRPWGRGTRPGPPAPILPPPPAWPPRGGPRGRPSPACPPARGGTAGPGRSVCCPGTPGAARRAGGGRWARARAWAGRVGGMRARVARAARAGLTGRTGGPGGRGQPAHLRRGGSQVPGRKEWIWFPRSLVYA